MLCKPWINFSSGRANHIITKQFSKHTWSESFCICIAKQLFVPSSCRYRVKTWFWDWFCHRWKGILPFTSLNGTLEAFNCSGRWCTFKSTILYCTKAQVHFKDQLPIFSWAIVLHTERFWNQHDFLGRHCNSCLNRLDKTFHRAHLLKASGDKLECGKILKVPILRWAIDLWGTFNPSARG